MIPGIGSQAEERLLRALDPAVTDMREATMQARDFTLIPGHDAEAARLGVQVSGGGEVMLVVTDPTRPLGQVNLQVAGRDTVAFFDNVAWGGNFHANIRILGHETLLFFNDIGAGYVALGDVYLRSHAQLLYWGIGASAVGCSMEIEGEGASVVIGDDALISAGVWVRNYDMHAMHDLRSGARVNRPPVDCVLERHVWLGQDAMLLSTERIGMGAIVGARALVKGRVPARVVVAGTPARVIREEVSWGRDSSAMTAAERASVGCPKLAGA